MDFDGPELWYEKVYFDDAIFVGQQDPDQCVGLQLENKMRGRNSASEVTITKRRSLEYKLFQREAEITNE